MTFWNFTPVIRNESDENSGGVVELRIEGDIIDDSSVWLYEWFDEPHSAPNKFRQELKQHEGKTLEVIINSYGGDVFAAASIYDDLKKRSGTTIGIVSGKAMSAGSVILMGCDQVKVSPTAMIMVHDPLTYLGYGSLSDFEQVVTVLSAVKETILNAYQLKTKKSRQELSDMMTMEKYMSAQEAVSLGFADEILYNEDQTIQNMKGFSFERSAVLNSAKSPVKQMQNFIEQRDESERVSEIELLELELDLM